MSRIRRGAALSLLTMALAAGVSPVAAQTWVGTGENIFPVTPDRIWRDNLGSYHVDYNTAAATDGLGPSNAFEASHRNDALDALRSRIAATDGKDNYPDLYSLNGLFGTERTWQNYVNPHAIRDRVADDFGTFVSGIPGMSTPNDPFATRVTDRFEGSLARTDFDRRAATDGNILGWFGGETTDQASTRFTDDARRTFWGSVVTELDNPPALSTHPDLATARDYYDGWQHGRTWADAQGFGPVRLRPSTERTIGTYEGAFQASEIFGATGSTAPVEASGLIQAAGPRPAPATESALPEGG